MKIAILVSLMIAHYLGDYTHLSTERMLDAKRTGKPLEPIWEHAYAHAFIFAICFVVYRFFNPMDFHIIAWTIIIELGTHFIIDVLKGKCNVWFPVVANPANKVHWYVFGLDQLLHHIVIVIVWWMVVFH